MRGALGEVGISFCNGEVQTVGFASAHSRSLFSNDTAHPGNGCGIVLKGIIGRGIID